MDYKQHTRWIVTSMRRVDWMRTAVGRVAVQVQNYPATFRTMSEKSNRWWMWRADGEVVHLMRPVGGAVVAVDLSGPSDDGYW